MQAGRVLSQGMIANEGCEGGACAARRRTFEDCRALHVAVQRALWVYRAAGGRE